ncbi:hypothetical protein EGK_14462 [Macaca mulatta]|uniref:Uncharacterized protein n=2 Tax=Macaca TaxID=9539 RepID=G7MQJ7_MACMU|nr:hypothetical protein EGK_14462 [Macaca mulatta]EHH52700.1 hypothetical protein EGM_13202 [Macaca fascicularis]
MDSSDETGSSFMSFWPHLPSDDLARNGITGFLYFSFIILNESDQILELDGTLVKIWLLAPSHQPATHFRFEETETHGPYVITGDYPRSLWQKSASSLRASPPCLWCFLPTPGCFCDHT